MKFAIGIILLLCITATLAENVIVMTTTSRGRNLVSGFSTVISSRDLNNGIHISLMNLTTTEQSFMKNIMGDFITIEPNGIVELADCKTDYYQFLDRLDQRETNPDGVYKPINTGKGSLVYLLDSGIQTNHSFFGNKRISQVKTFINNDLNPKGDDNGHGTAMASIILNVSPDAQIKAIKIFNANGRGSVFDLVDGILWAGKDCEKNGNSRCILNASLQSGKYSSLLIAINDALSKGIVFISAAGNGGNNACNVYPASHDGVLSVGAVDEDDRFPSFSNYGSCINILAPGTNLEVAKRTCSSTDPYIHREMSGTSGSTAVVSGIAAQLLSIKRIRQKNIRRCLLRLAIRNQAKLKKGNNTPNRIAQVPTIQIQHLVKFCNKRL